ncbi:hypothetical protein P3S68_015770 [Capsicum galapagoense]
MQLQFLFLWVLYKLEPLNPMVEICKSASLLLGGRGLTSHDQKDVRSTRSTNLSKNGNIKIAVYLYLRWVAQGSATSRNLLFCEGFR